jgi:hypothetical protein
MEDTRPNKRARQACEPCRLVSHVIEAISWLITVIVARNLNALERSPYVHIANALVKYAYMNQALMAKVNALVRTDHWYVNN